jgi:hypothetical protein
MLHSISWGSFLSIITEIAALYYFAIGAIFFRKQLAAWVKKKLSMTVLLVALVCHLHAQTADGNNGINEANTLIRSYFQTGTQLLYGVSALVALVGAVRVFVLWNSGHREEMTRCASAWFGSCIFIAVVALIIQSFFGL